MRSVLAITLLISGLGAGATFADEAADMAAIKARQDYFKSLGAVMKPMGGLTKSFDAEAVAAEAAKLKTALETDVAPYFAPGTSTNEYPEATRAKPVIWEEMEDFGSKGAALHEAGMELIAVAEAGDEAAFAPAFMKLGGTCKACHDDYRAPK